LRINEAQQDGVHIYLGCSKDLALIPSTRKKILFSPPKIRAIKTELAQRIFCGFNVKSWIYLRDAINGASR
jgi:hypothetical protein